MNNRIKELRKNLSLSQTEFGKKLGVTNATISRIENKKRNITEQMILSICQEFNVNENWLRTGEGEMFNKTSEENEISKWAWINSILQDKPEPLKNGLLAILSTLNENKWEFLKQKPKK